MKAIDLIKTLVKGEFDIDRCGVASYDLIQQTGWWAYFGARYFNGILESGYEYFYAYLDEDEQLINMPPYDVDLIVEPGKTKVYLWKIQN